MDDEITQKNNIINVQVSNQQNIHRWPDNYSIDSDNESMYEPQECTTKSENATITSGSGEV